MGYEKQNFVKGQKLTAAQMNHIEDGIEEIDIKIDNIAVEKHHTLTFEGAVTGTYDGSSDVIITIPTISGENGEQGETGNGIDKIEKTSTNNLVDTYTITYTNGTTTTFTVTNGEKGDKGETGASGNDGVGIDSTSINEHDELVIAYTDGNSTNLGVVVGAKGEQGIQGEKGEKGDAGYTPVKGIDYYTEADKAELVSAVIAALPDASEVSY
jgi:hypothetical protein